MTLNLVKPESVVSSAYARWLIYGPNGAGKSTLAATLPRPMMVISARGENMAPYAGLNNVIINLIDDWEQIHETYMMLRGPQGKAIKSVVQDTLTRLMLGFYLSKLVGVKTSPEEIINYLKTSPAKKDTTFNIWRDVGEQTIRTVLLYNELPMNTVYLCQEDTRQPKFDHDLLKTFPMLSPFGWEGVKDIVHMIGRVYAVEESGGLSLENDNGRGIKADRKDKRMLLIGQHDRYTTKGDTRTLGYVVENPSWDNLSKALKQ